MLSKKKNNKTECTNGWYSVNCSRQCSGHCRENIPCNHVTGHCDKGCDTGWTGTLCINGKKKPY